MLELCGHELDLERMDVRVGWLEWEGMRVYVYVPGWVRTCQGLEAEV